MRRINRPHIQAATTPTRAQEQILEILLGTGGRWVPLRWLDSTPMLHEDDFPVVPSLIENGWAAYIRKSIQITPEGVAAMRGRGT